MGIKRAELSAGGFCVPQRNDGGAVVSLCLICGTSLERIEPESLTPSLSEFVHGYISVGKQVGTLILVESSLGPAMNPTKAG